MRAHTTTVLRMVALNNNIKAFTLNELHNTIDTPLSHSFSDTCVNVKNGHLLKYNA